MSQNEFDQNEENDDSYYSEKKANNSSSRSVSSPTSCKPGSHFTSFQNTEEVKPSSWDNSDEECLNPNDWDSPTPRFRINIEPISYDLTSPESLLRDFFKNQSPNKTEGELSERQNDISAHIDRRQSPARIRRRTKSSSSSSPLLDTKNEFQAANNPENVTEVSLGNSLHSNNFYSNLQTKSLMTENEKSLEPKLEETKKTEQEPEKYSSLEALKNSFDDDSPYHRRIFTKLSQILESEEVKKDYEESQKQEKLKNQNESNGSTRPSNISTPVTDHRNNYTPESSSLSNEVKESCEVQTKNFLLQKSTSLGEFENFGKSNRFRGSLSERDCPMIFNELYDDDIISLTAKPGETNIGLKNHKNGESSITTELIQERNDESNENFQSLETHFKDLILNPEKDSFRSDESLKDVKTFDKATFESPRFSIDIDSSRSLKFGSTNATNSVGKVTDSISNHSEASERSKGSIKSCKNNSKQEVDHCFNKTSRSFQGSELSVKSDGFTKTEQSGTCSKRSKTAENQTVLADIQTDQTQALHDTAIKDCIIGNEKTSSSKRKSDSVCSTPKSLGSKSRESTSRSKSPTFSIKLQPTTSSGELSVASSHSSAKISESPKSNPSFELAFPKVESPHIQSNRSLKQQKIDTRNLSEKTEETEKYVCVSKKVLSNPNTERNPKPEPYPTFRLCKSLESYSTNQNTEEWISNSISNSDEFSKNKYQDLTKCCVDFFPSIMSKNDSRSNLKSPTEPVTYDLIGKQAFSKTSSNNQLQHRSNESLTKNAPDVYVNEYCIKNTQFVNGFPSSFSEKIYGKENTTQNVPKIQIHEDNIVSLKSKEQALNTKTNVNEERWIVLSETLDSEPVNLLDVSTVANTSHKHLESPVEKTPRSAFEFENDPLRYFNVCTDDKNEPVEKTKRTPPSTRQERKEDITIPPFVENSVPEIIEADNKSLSLHSLQISIKGRPNETVGMGEFGDVSSWNDDPAETSDKEKPNDQGDGPQQNYALKLKQGPKSPPRKSWAGQNSTLSLKQKEIPKQDTYVVETCFVFKNLKISKSDSSIHKNRTCEIQFENVECELNKDYQRNIEKSSLHNSNKLEPVCNVEPLQRTTPNSNFQNTKEESLPIGEPKSKNWLIVKDRRRKKRRQKGGQEFCMDETELPSNWTTQHSMATLKFRNSSCLRKFYKRIVSVFCVTSESSAASSK